MSELIKSHSRTLPDGRVLVLLNEFYKIINGKLSKTYACKPYYEGQFDLIYNAIINGKWQPPQK